MYYSNPFDVFFNTSPRYIVISDSELTELKVRQAHEDVLVLKSQANRLETALAEVKDKLTLKEEYIQKHAGALNGSQTTEALSQSGTSSDT